MPQETMEELVEEFCAVKRIFQFEGNTKNLEKLVQGIGYRNLSSFFGDNPGAQEAIVNWISDQELDNWKEEIETHLPEKEEDEE